MIKLIVDSTADLPSDYFDNYQIGVVPLIVNINNKEYKDKKTIAVDELYQSLKKGDDVKTSQPNPFDVYEAIEKEAKNNHDIIFISISSKLSGTYQTVFMVVEELKEKYPDIKIKIIDSKGGSGIPGLMAIKAAQLIENNTPFPNIIQVLEEMTNHSEHIFTVKDLKYLFKSGRLKKSTALIGNLLHFKPILHIEHGEIKLLQKVRGQNKAFNKMVDLVEERIKNYPDQTIAIMHANDLEVALVIKQKLIERLGHKDFIIDQIGSAMGTHIGIGGVGVFFFNKKI
ncbi:DegV family protein [Mycoplasmatota bacterium]|nr:DegV family protein [Mycoplasmatota bacterium]